MNYFTDYCNMKDRMKNKTKAKSEKHIKKQRPGLCSDVRV
ncbi:hypothetical protein HMP0721_1769 [Pseudoramibacter alactolyticus ATCC 23263]|uniref:Uncharacterized protein n=1 Tax=Pseudoramibacter alactolyticus ATCC 23263 TaxID=887929 RepID=E6MID4_9FIRM|nr:hypothetical protein HMP0721_1769 [Pseudoramibacter alactolyticus ATCC 23263]